MLRKQASVLLRLINIQNLSPVTIRALLRPAFVLSRTQITNERVGKSKE